MIGVIASLVFVGVEIRQNTQAVRGSTYQSLTESSMELLFRVADDPEVGAQIDAWGAGAELEPAVRSKVEALVTAYLRHLENAYYQMEEGTLRPEFLENWSGNPTFGLPHFAVFWGATEAGLWARFSAVFREPLESVAGCGSAGVTGGLGLGGRSGKPAKLAWLPDKELPQSENLDAGTPLLP